MKIRKFLSFVSCLAAFACTSQPVAPTLRASTAVDDGSVFQKPGMESLKTSIIGARIASYEPQLKDCYQKALPLFPHAEGRIATEFTINATGHVSEAKVTDTSMNLPVVENCVLEVVKGMVFPRPAGGGTVVVNYPFRFRPAAASSFSPNGDN